MNKVDWRLTWRAGAAELEVGQAEVFLADSGSGYRRAAENERRTLATGDKVALRFLGGFCDVAIIGDRSQVRTLPANIVPLHARQAPNFVTVSPMPERLFATGEVLRFDPLSFFTKLTGRWHPFLGQFANAETLHASTDYRVGREGLVKERDRICYVSNASVNGISAYVEGLFDRLCADSRRIVIPLSGGYDSRLILACAKHQCDKSGKELAVLHSVQSDKELRIVQHLCDLIGVRPQIIESHREEIDDKNFVRLVSKYGEFACGPFQRPGFVGWY